MNALWIDKVPSAEIEMLQLFWVSASILLLSPALETNALGYWLAAMACVTGGVLTKWSAPVFFYATAIPLALNNACGSCSVGDTC